MSVFDNYSAVLIVPCFINLKIVCSIAACLPACLQNWCPFLCAEQWLCCALLCARMPLPCFVLQWVINHAKDGAVLGCARVY